MIEQGGPATQVSPLREKALQAKDEKHEPLEIPEWGVTFEIRSMNGRERSEFIKRCSNPDGNIDPVRGYPDLTIRCTFDPTLGVPVFLPTDRDPLMEKNGAMLERICEVALRINGFDVKTRDQIKKDLAGAPNGGSTSK